MGRSAGLVAHEDEHLLEDGPLGDGDDVLLEAVSKESSDCVRGRILGEGGLHGVDVQVADRRCRRTEGGRRSAAAHEFARRRRVLLGLSPLDVAPDPRATP